jgi:gamma-glutamyl-gamma-aminobutyraldehyde dehydrogenase
VDFAVSKAREAFDRGDWSRLHPSERKEVLIRLCKLITRRRRELAVMESLDSGKPIRDCEMIDMPETIHTIKWHAELIDKIYDQVPPSGDDALAMILREPIGVVACVLPWNFPLLMMAWKIGPALAAGNSVIVKPAEQTSADGAARGRTGAWMAGAARGVAGAAGRAGRIGGRTAGPAHGCRHGQLHRLDRDGRGSCATRRTATSRRSRSNAGARTRVVLDDAENLDHVAEHVANAAFWNMGENCSAPSRLIVHGGEGRRSWSGSWRACGIGKPAIRWTRRTIWARWWPRRIATKVRGLSHRRSPDRGRGRGQFHRRPRYEVDPDAPARGRRSSAPSCR